MTGAPLLDAFDFAGVVFGDYPVSHPMNLCGDSVRLTRNSLRTFYEGLACLRINAVIRGVQALNLFTETGRMIARMEFEGPHQANVVGGKQGSR